MPSLTMRPVERYEGFLLDLDGVLYRGDQLVDGAGEAVAGLRHAGRSVIYLTNNSARTPDQIAEKLQAMGMEASPEEVVTSAQATARVVATMARRDSRAPTAFVVGERGVREALAGAGIDVLDEEPEEVGFVVVGWDRAMDYERLRIATVLVRAGARLVATNADPSYPAPDGQQWPGAGALLAAVETASGARATVVGKPHRPLFDAAVERAVTSEVLMVGDRIETDIVGALEAGLDAALVLTGAATPGDLLDQDGLPVMVLDDVAGLLDERPDVRLRQAQDQDADAIVALLRAASLDPDPVRGSLSGTVVAADGGIVAAAAAPVRGGGAYLHSVAVTEESRGWHLGTLVTAAALRGAAGRGARQAFLLTETAEGFFAGLGFERIGREALPRWIAGLASECSESAAVMRRPLGGSRQ